MGKRFLCQPRRMTRPGVNAGIGLAGRVAAGTMRSKCIALVQGAQGGSLVKPGPTKRAYQRHLLAAAQYSWRLSHPLGWPHG